MTIPNYFFLIALYNFKKTKWLIANALVAANEPVVVDANHADAVAVAEEEADTWVVLNLITTPIPATVPLRLLIKSRG